MGIEEKNILENAHISLAKVSETADIAFVVMAESGGIDEVTATEHLDVFSPWVAGISYSVGNLRTFNNGTEQKLYKCVQAHMSQADWTPDTSASLWSAVGDPTVEFPDWSQPVGAHDAYQEGDKVSYNGAHWISTTANNVWSPGVYGWDIIE
jgi:hypothetical protein